MSGCRATRSRATAALAFALVLGGLAGCGGGKDFARSGTVGAPDRTETLPTVGTTTVAPRKDPVLRSIVRGAVARTATGRTARSSISVTVTGIGDRTFGTGTFDVAGTGVVDLRSGDAKLVLSVPRFDRITGGHTVAQRIVHGVSYIESPPEIMLAGGLSASVRWLRLDPRAPLGADASALAQAQVDPAGQLAFLGAISDDVRAVGVEAVRGVPTKHYVATIDVPAQLSRSATGIGARLASIEDVIGSARVAVDVWIDGAGRARRVVVSIPLSNATVGIGGPAGKSAVMRVQTDLYAFGTPVAVTVPPAAQVRPYAALHLPAVAG